MNPEPFNARLGPLIAAIVIVSSASAGMAQAPAAAGKDSTPHAMQGMPGDRGDMRGTTMSMMKSMESMPASGDIDRDFAEMMKVHHQGAIDMAQLELKQGKDAKMRAMARRIIEAQRKEILEFERWLARRK